LALAVKNRRKNGLKRYETLKKELDGMVKTLLERNIVLALENMPYLEGFPDESELERFVGDFKGAPIKLWCDSGHQYIRGVLGYNSKSSDEWKAELESLAMSGMIRGMHINDVLDIDDDHLAPGEGNVDFVSFEKVAKNVEHIVFEPNANVDPSKLKAGVKYLKEIWK
jgi:sugar phosphate isomerase/epimerase